MYSETFQLVRKISHSKYLIPAPKGLPKVMYVEYI
jgi:hypothetical protein